MASKEGRRRLGDRYDGRRLRKVPAFFGVMPHIMKRRTDSIILFDDVIDIDELEELAYYIKDNALCGLGQTAPNPVLSTLRYFKDEYMAHVVDKKCPAGVCKALLQYKILPDKCRGCSLCSKKCPVNCISGEIKKPFVIDQSQCIKCGTCMDSCKFGAIVRE